MDQYNIKLLTFTKDDSIYRWTPNPFVNGDMQIRDDHVNIRYDINYDAYLDEYATHYPFETENTKTVEEAQTFIQNLYIERIKKYLVKI